MLEQISNFIAGMEWMWILVIVGVLIFGAKKFLNLQKPLVRPKAITKKEELNLKKI